MAKYILKESELRCIIEEAVREELNEGFWRGVGNVAQKAGKGLLMPSLFAKDTITKANNIINGNETMAGTIRDIFNTKNGSNGSGSGRQNGADKMATTYNINYEYGHPEMVSGPGRSLKLDAKREITLPNNAERTPITPNGTDYIDWGDFGFHYHDKGDEVWKREFLSIEAQLIRISDHNPEVIERNFKKYKKRLVNWLNKRDKIYLKYRYLYAKG